MESQANLVAAMAEQCRIQIQDFNSANVDALPKPLQLAHLAWMCHQIEENASNWPQVKLHRWLGFIQCGMLANRMVDLQAVKRMFDKLKIAFGTSSEDLVDHLDTESAFRLDIGGQG